MPEEFRQGHIVFALQCLGLSWKTWRLGPGIIGRLTCSCLVAILAVPGDLFATPQRPTPFGLPYRWVWTSLQDGDWVSRWKVHHLCFIASEVMQCPFCLMLFIFYQISKGCLYLEGWEADSTSWWLRVKVLGEYVTQAKLLWPWLYLGKHSLPQRVWKSWWLFKQ